MAQYCEQQLFSTFKLKIFDNHDQEESDNLLEKNEGEHEEDDEIEISTSAMKATVNFIRLSCQQTCFIAGKKKIEEEVTCLTAQGQYKATYCMYILCTCTVAYWGEPQ